MTPSTEAMDAAKELGDHYIRNNKHVAAIIDRHFADVIRKAERLAKIIDAAKWHPASEPPDSDRAVMIFDSDELQDVGYHDTNRRMWIHENDDIAHVTHWRELPAPPEINK